MLKISDFFFVKEFDVQTPDVSERAADVHDFIRSVFSHPNTEAQNLNKSLVYIVSATILTMQ